MRTCTLVVSIAVHAIVFGALIAVPLTATGDLPDLPRATAFLLVRPSVLPAPPRPVPPRATAPQVNPDAAPIVEPVSVQPETVIDVPPEPAGASTVDGGIDSGGSAASSSSGGEPAAVVSPPPVDITPLRVGGAIRPPEKIRHVAPIYPSIAQAAHVSGVVILEAVIGEDGSVRNVTVLRSARLLDDAAIEAVRQWRFTPTLLNGQAVAVVMTVTVGFTLN